MAKKERKLTTTGLLITATLYIVSLPFTVRKACDAAGNLSTVGDLFVLLGWILTCLFIIMFQFHHVDTYTTQRGNDVNIAGLLSFFIISVFLVASVA